MFYQLTDKKDKKDNQQTRNLQIGTIVSVLKLALAPWEGGWLLQVSFTLEQESVCIMIVDSKTDVRVMLWFGY